MVNGMHASVGHSLAAEMALLQQERHAADNAAGKSDATKEGEEIKAKHAEELEAENKAKEEAKSSSFWGDVAGVAKVAGTVAAIGAVAATGGVGAIALVGAGALVSAYGGEAAKKLGAGDVGVHCVEVVGIGMSVAGGGLAGGGASELAQGIAVAGKATAGGAAVVHGVATYKKGAAQAAETDAHADGTAAKHAADETKTDRDETFKRLEHQALQHRESMGMVQKLARAEQETTDVVYTHIRG